MVNTPLGPRSQQAFLPSKVSIWTVVPPHLPSISYILSSELFDEIESSYGVLVERCQAPNSRLKLRGIHPGPVSRAVLDIKISIETHRLSHLSEVPMFIVSRNDVSSAISLTPGSHFMAGRPVVDNRVEHHSTSSSTHFPKFEHEMSILFAPAIKSAGMVGLGLQMRVKFGYVKLKEAKKGKSTYTNTELRDLLHTLAIRGTAGFETGLPMCNPILNNVQNFFQSKSDTHPSPGYQPAVQDSVILELVSANTTVEIEITKPQGKNAIIRRAFEQQDQKFVNIIVSCPERNIDWALVLETRHQVAWNDNIGKALNDARVRDLLRDWGGPDCPDLPGTMVEKLFERSDKITVKRRKALPYKRSPYVIQYTETRLWRKPGTAHCEHTCGIDLFCPWWDEVLTGAKTKAKRGVWWSAETDSLLPGPAAPFEAKFKSFLGEIEGVLQMFNQ